jgi:hypothetical protein
MADWKDALLAKTEDTTPDIDADFGLTHDASGSVLKKVLLKNWVGTVLAALRSAFTPASSSTAASLKLAEDADNGSHYVEIAAPASLGANRSWTFPDAAGTFVGHDTAQTLTNKRIDPRTGTTASSATPTPAGDSNDLYTITALAAAAELQAPSGTPVNGQGILIRIKDDGTPRALTYNAIYREIGVTLPTTTAASKTIYLGCVYNSADSKWDVLGVAEEA